MNRIFQIFIENEILFIKLFTTEEPHSLSIQRLKLFRWVESCSWCCLFGLKSFDFKSNFQKTSVDHDEDDDEDDDEADDEDRDECEAEARGREKIGGRKAIMK